MTDSTSSPEQRGLSQDTKALMEFDNDKKSTGIAYVLWFLVGILGAHRFYLKRTGSAIIMLLLSITFFGLVVTLIWWVVDIFLISGMVDEYNRNIRMQINSRY